MPLNLAQGKRRKEEKEGKEGKRERGKESAGTYETGFEKQSASIHETPPSCLFGGSSSACVEPEDLKESRWRTDWLLTTLLFSKVLEGRACRSSSVRSM